MRLSHGARIAIQKHAPECVLDIFRRVPALLLSLHRNGPEELIAAEQDRMRHQLTAAIAKRIRTRARVVERTKDLELQQTCVVMSVEEFERLLVDVEQAGWDECEKMINRLARVRAERGSRPLA